MFLNLGKFFKEDLLVRSFDGRSLSEIFQSREVSLSCVLVDAF